MAERPYKRHRRAPVAVLAALLTLGAGCGPTNYKQDADERVYDLIDRQWDPAFGPRTNYKVSDTPPAPDAVQIERAVPASGIITLSQAVALATAHNREYQTQRDLLYTTALDLRLVQRAYETQLFGGGSVLYTNDGAGWRDELVAAEANVGFNRLLATGTQISTRVALAWFEILSGRRDRGLASIFDVAVTHPLLRGSDRRVVMEDLTQAERDLLYQIRSFNRFRKTFVVSVISQYYRALELRVLADHAANYVAALEELGSQVENLVGAGYLPVHEHGRVVQEKLRAQDIHIEACKLYREALDNFAITLGLAPTATFDLHARAMEMLRAQGIPKPELVETEVIETALCRRLDLTNRADAVLDAQRHVYVAADGLRAELNLVVDARAQSHGFDDEAVAGAVLDLPLDRVPEQSLYRKALLAANQRQRDYDLAADTVRLEVRRAHRNLIEAADRHDVALERLDEARERIDKTQALMEYGRVSSRRVLGAEFDLFLARDAATRALVNYAVATLEFYRDSGVLQVRPDGMWEL
jgi:outer membrane protein TolC